MRVGSAGFRVVRRGARDMMELSVRAAFSMATGFHWEMCMPAALANTISCVRGTADADEAMRRGLANQSWRDVCDASKWIRREVLSVSLDKVRDANGVIFEVTEDSILRECDFVAVVELVGNGGFRHMICIDGARSLIFDVCEAFASKLSKKSLDWCFDLELKQKKFANLRRVRDLMPGKSMPKGILLKKRSLK